MLGDGKEQFTITTRVDDSFLHSKTVVRISRWDLFKALFRKQFTVTVEVSVRGTEDTQMKSLALFSSEPRLLQAKRER